MIIEFLLIIAKFTSSNQCEGPNTVLAFTNECVCVDGFPYGDPNSNEGCYKCDKKCHRLSKCEYPGKCVCTSPYHGDGVEYCSLDIPHLISISPNNGSTSGGTDIQINYEYSNYNNKKTPDNAFCRFGPLVVRSKSVSDTTIICQTPPHRAKPSFLSISFDTLSWSKEQIFFNFIDIQDKKVEIQTDDVIEVDNNRNKNTGLFPMVIICIFLFLALLILVIKRYQFYQLPLAFRKKGAKD